MRSAKHARVETAGTALRLDAEGDRLNFAGALREMSLATSGDLISVNDDGTSVRIWIDER